MKNFKKKKRRRENQKKKIESQNESIYKFVINIKQDTKKNLGKKKQMNKKSIKNIQKIIMKIV